MEARFKVEACDENFVRITVLCPRPPGAHALPDQEARGAMAMPRCVWFMCAIVRGFAVQFNKPVLARALEQLEKRASENFDRELARKAQHDKARGTDV